MTSKEKNINVKMMDFTNDSRVDFFVLHNLHGFDTFCISFFFLNVNYFRCITGKPFYFETEAS